MDDLWNLNILGALSKGAGSRIGGLKLLVNKVTLEMRFSAVKFEDLSATLEMTAGRWTSFAKASAVKTPACRLAGTTVDG